MRIFDPLPAASQAIRQARRGALAAFDDGPVGDMMRDAVVAGMPLWLERHRGWLYLASNPSWPGLVKVGCTRKSVDRRLAGLSGAGVPTPWELLHAWPAYDAFGLEARAHAACAQWLYRSELFSAPASLVAEAIHAAIQADRLQLLRQLQDVFLPGQLETLLEGAAHQNADSCAYTS